MPEAETDGSAAVTAGLPLPPSRIRFMGESDQEFLEVGDESVADLRGTTGLGNDERILDIGCGYGRLAHALLRDGTFEGTYLGVDILRKPIEWCQAELAPRSAGRAQFRQIDVANARYNPSGNTLGHLAELGVDPGGFDVVVLISVLTHMDPPTVARYLAEAARALAPGGRVFITAFLLDESWRKCNEDGLSPILMTHELTPFCRYTDAEDPLAAIGYEPDWLAARAADAGLELSSPSRLGGWCGRPDGIGHLDVMALRRSIPRRAA
jgi:SAM-dependent methyltransferase